MTETEIALKYVRQDTSTSQGLDSGEYDTLALPTTEDEESAEVSSDGLVHSRHVRICGFRQTSTLVDLPFNVLHENSKPFDSPNRKVLIPGIDIIVQITDVDRNPASHVLNPNLYIIHIQHGNFQWIVKRRYKHFHDLHHDLQIFRTALRIPIPTKKHREIRKNLKNAEGKKNLPRLPKRPEAMIIANKVKQRAEQLETYLNNLLKVPMYRNHYKTLQFLSISHLSFIGDLGAKGKEGVVKKKAGGHRIPVGVLHIRRLFWNWCTQWKRRWLIVKDNFVAYVCPHDGQIKTVLLMDQEFEVRYGLFDTGIHHGVLVSNATRRLLVKCWTARKAREWAQHMMDTAKTTARDFTQPNRYGSFSPVRIDTECRWFIDGATYMESVAEVLESAQEEIFITDWWLSPEIYMKRPAMEGETWRLDKILQRKARQGVQVYILLYKEVEMALGINSLYSKQKLVIGSHNSNIKVLRHPDHVTGGILLWAHHEKIVCVDQKYAFLGGIDLCYGRWDNYLHRLTDLGGVCKEKSGIKFSSSAPKGTPVMLRKPICKEQDVVDISKSTRLIDSDKNDDHGSDSGIHRSSTIDSEIPVNKEFCSGSIKQRKRNTSWSRRLFRQRSLSDSNLLANLAMIPSLYVSAATMISEYQQKTSSDSMLASYCKSYVTTFSDPRHKCNGLPLKCPLWIRILHGLVEAEGKQLNVECEVGNGLLKLDSQTARPNSERIDVNVCVENPGVSITLAPPSEVSSCEGANSSEGDDDTSDVDKVDHLSGKKKQKKRKRLERIKGEAVEAKKKVTKRLQSIKGRRRRRSLESINSLNIGIVNDKNANNELDIPYTDLRRTNSEKVLNDLGITGTTKLWYGKDYCNFIVKDFVALNAPYQDLIDRHTTPRMPWHDIGVMVAGNAAKDVARHFIQRWNFTKFEKAKHHDNYPWLLPKSYNEEIPLQSSFPRDKMFCCSAQILRSVGQWSTGVKYTEESIHNAYVDAIYHAQHFIYIENQFFISQPAGKKDVTNEIAESLYRRIIQAHRKNEVFRVYVVMPLLPAFEGEIGTNNGTAIQAITHWNYASICRGPDSLLQRLATEVGDPTNYISFYGLRTHSVLNEEMVTELIYVHSKLMIVDDMKVIIGSANINDRSLLGKRDSEIAVIVKDSDTEISLMNGVQYEAGRFAGSLRRTLFREHLGLLESDCGEIDVRDPICDHFFKNVWIKTAAMNTFVFEKVFRCIPSDEIHSFNHLKSYQNEIPLCSSDPVTSKQLLMKVKGHLVLFPLHFLCMENLTPAVTSKEILMPTYLWT